MSVLTGKHILVIGEETNQISKVEAALITYGATVTSTTCEASDPDKVASQAIDLILLNHLHEGTHCRQLLETFKGANLEKDIPVFVLVERDEMHINDAFSLGAADYITPDEDPHLVVEKIKAIFGDSTNGGEVAAIDITPAKAVGGDGIRVFVVEDDPLLRNLLAVKFEKSNLPFELAENGDGVIEKITAFHPQIVILDLMLPGKDGFAILSEIKASTSADVPVMIFSNKDSQEDRQKASQLGAVAFYVKAMTDLSELISLIEQHAKH